MYKEKCARLIGYKKQTLNMAYWRVKHLSLRNVNRKTFHYWLQILSRDKSIQWTEIDLSH